MRKAITTCIPVLLTFYLFCSLQSCKIVSNRTGRLLIPFTNDSIATVKLKKSLNGLTDHDFLTKSFLSKGDIILPYRLLTPVDQQSSKKYPLIITFHNSSRIGSDNKSQLEPLARLWLDSAVRKKYQGYVVAPQFSIRSTNYKMDHQRGILTSSAEPQLVAVLDLIDSLVKLYNIDEKRIYLVGYSMGGSSVIDLLNLRPGEFSAAVAIAPVPQFNNVLSMMNVPIWLIHGTADTENPFAGSERLYQEIGLHHKTRFWIFDNRTHDNIVSTALLNENIPKWLFSHR